MTTRSVLGRVVGVMTFACAVLATSTAMSPPAGATAVSTGWSIAPAVTGPGAPQRSLFQFTGKPGQVFTDRFVVANRSAGSITFNIYSADGYNTKVGGAFALKVPNAPQVDVGKWITLPTNKLVLPPRTQASVSYTVRIPPNAYPGDHAGGIVAQDAAPLMTQRGALKVPVLEGAGVRVYIRVEGPTHPSLAVANPVIAYSYPAFAWANGSGKGRLAFQIADTGNTRLDVVAHVKAENLFGSTIKEFPPLKVPALLPGNTSAITEPVIGLPHLGLVKFDIALQSKEANANASVQATLIPWTLIVVFIVIIAFLALLWWRYRRSKRVPPEPDDAAKSSRRHAPTRTAVG